MPRTLNRRLHRRLHPACRDGEGRCNPVFSFFFPSPPSVFFAFHGNIRPLPPPHTSQPSVVGYFRPILASFRRGNCCSGSQRVAISHEESPPFLAVNSFHPYLQTFRGEKSRFPYSFVTDRGQSSCWNIFFPRTKRNLSFPIFLFPPNCN